jgi:hypothetical protein
MVLPNRLKAVGAEERIWSTQYRFRSKVGTAYALFSARRKIEEAIETRGGTAVLLALDWAKAFGSVSPDAVAQALRRFGIPENFVQMLRSIYSDRLFYVRDAGHESRFHKQDFGMCQGCPLSPFLFTIVMTVLVTDAKHLLEEKVGPNEVRELLYADDTLLIDQSGGHVQEYMDCVHSIGAEYGLAFNCGRLEACTVNCKEVVLRPDGVRAKHKSSMVYLGSLLADDGRVEPELSKWIVATRVDFEALCRVWGHAGITRAQKLRILEACVMSKLMCALHTAWLTVAARRRLDGFQTRCLRRIVDILPSFLSRVPNAEVLRQAKLRRASALLLEQQLRLFGRVALSGDASAVRRACFEPGPICLRALQADRRAGRPRNHWPQMVRAHAVALAGGEYDL